MSSAPGTDGANAHGSLFSLTEELTDRIRRGEEVSLHAVLAEHPQHADRLRQVWPTLDMFAAVGQSAVREAFDGPALIAAPLEVRCTLGDFHILREIGRGGMGVVYEAEQLSLGRRVALKVLPFAGVLDDRRLQRFRNEARAAAALQHPHIVPVYAVGSERGVHFYAMQLIDGPTLEAVIRALRGRLKGRGSRIEDRRSEENRSSEFGAGSSEFSSRGSEAAVRNPPCTVPDSLASETSRLAGLSTADSAPGPAFFRRVAELGIQAAEALDYAHVNGVIHRDVKPSNLMLDGRGTLWVADFGLARLESDANLTNTGELMGTLRYASPEQALAFRGLVDQRSDVYSLGATLYELLTLQPAFPETDRRELLRQIGDDDPPPLSLRSGTIPVELQTIVLKSLEKLPQDRYATAHDLAADLRRFLESKPLAARPPTLRDRAIKWSRRHRPVVRATAISALIALAAGLTAAALVIDARHTAETERIARGAQAVVAQAERRNRLLHEYVERINLANRAVSLGEFEKARRLLEACVPGASEEDLRGFEWHYLNRLARTQVTVIGRHEGSAFEARQSPDRRWIVSCGRDGVRLWDARTLQPARRLLIHNSDVPMSAFSPDGKWLAATCNDGMVRIWDTETWRLVTILRHGGPSEDGMFTPDSAILVTGEQVHELFKGVSIGRNVVHLWDAQNQWKSLGDLPVQAAGLASIDVSPDGSRIAAGYGDGRIRIYNTRERTLDREIEHRGASDDNLSGVVSIAFARRHSWLAAGNWSAAIHLWDPADGSRLARLPHPGRMVERIAFSADDSLLAATCEQFLVVWELQHFGEYTQVLILRGTSNYWKLTFAGPETILATHGDGRIVRIDLRQARAESRFRTGGNGDLDADISPDGRWLATACLDVVVHDLRSSGRAVTLPRGDSSVEAIRFSPDGRFLIAGDRGHHTVAFWDTTDWKLAREFPVSVSIIEGIELAEAGTRLAVWSDQQPRRDWHDLPSGRHAVEPLPRDKRFAAVRDGQLFAHELDGPSLVVRDGENVLWSADLPGLNDFAFSPGGEWIAVGRVQGTLEIRRAIDGQVEGTCLSAFPPAHCVFSPDGRTVAASDEPPKTVRLWNRATGRELLTIPVDFMRIRRILFSPDGRRLFIAGRGPTNKAELMMIDGSE